MLGSDDINVLSKIACSVPRNILNILFKGRVWDNDIDVLKIACSVNWNFKKLSFHKTGYKILFL